jgi:hypothetical protein
MSRYCLPTPPYEDVRARLRALRRLGMARMRIVELIKGSFDNSSGEKPAIIKSRKNWTSAGNGASLLPPS